MKKLLSLFLCITLASCFASGAVYAGDPAATRGYVIVGDADGDSEVTDWDAIVLARYLAGWKVEIDLSSLDTDGDLEISDWDSIVLNRFLAGWYPALPFTGSVTAFDLVRFLTSGEFKSNRQPGEVSDEFKAGYLDFAVRLTELCGEGGEALVSPLSVMTALLMTANGAKGDTLREMLDMLLGGMPLDEANAQIFNYYASLINTENSSLEDANAVFVTDDESLTVSPDFVEVIKNTFNAGIAEADFSDPGTVDIINRWCDENTGGMIKKILEYDEVSPDTVMVLLNALCFNALWREQYADCMVKETVFHGKNGDTNVDMMYNLESGYIKGKKEEGFIKYYKDCGYAFVALLPEEGTDISTYLNDLSGSRLLSLLNSAKGAVNAGIPEFSYDMSMKLNSVLQEMGMVKAFTGECDLSGLFSDGAGGFSVSLVIHKTHIEVDPSGTRAAAVTAVEVAKSVGPDQGDIPEVILDRPFVYMIVDTGSMLPVFLGSLTDVSK